MTNSESSKLSVGGMLGHRTITISMKLFCVPFLLGHQMPVQLCNTPGQQEMVMVLMPLTSLCLFATDTADGSEICCNFNAIIKGCSRADCQYRHICNHKSGSSACEGNHQAAGMCVNLNND